MERLLNYFIPEKYVLDLRIYKETEKDVVGVVYIYGEIKSDTVKFHAENMEIADIYLSVEKDDEQSVDFTYEDGVIAISNQKAAKNACYHIVFKSKLNRNMEGNYLSTYKYNGKEERIVTTQFESHYAREAFPCIDEPEAKATFDLTIKTDATEDTVLSNMPIKKQSVATTSAKNKEELLVTNFEETPRMSTYLLAWVIGKFNKVTTHSLHGVKVTTYAALNQSKTSLKFSNDIAAETLDFYDDTFGIPYPLPKLDQVALPDFEAGAMENWGLVTFREACLLAEKDSSKSHKEYVATVVTHELSHQWFGDLVTMKWWDNLWLNESFANMMQFYSVDKLHPDWHIWQDFFTDDCYYALRRDALPGVQAVQQEVKDPAEIAALFDGAIVYAKGSHLMFMLMRLMGEKPFFAGLKAYFKKHQYGNTTGDDLWAALQKHAKFDVKEFMDAWILQSGYPMIADETQQRFLLNGATDNTKWPLPEITDDMSGHYIICLSAPEFEAKVRNFNNLNLEQKLRLLIDRELLSKTPIVSSGSLISLLPKFQDETSASVFSIVSDIASSLKIFCAPDTEYYPLYQRYVYNIVAPNLKRLGLEPVKDEDEDDTKLRAYCLGFAIYSRDERTLKGLSRIYDRDVVEKDSLRDYTKLNSEIRSAVIDAKFRLSDEENFDELLADYQAAVDPSIKSALLSTLTTAEHDDHIDTLIGLLEKPEIVRPQDHVYLFSYLLGNYYARVRTYDWFYKHWDYIISITSDKSMDDYVRIASGRVRTEEDANRFFEFFDQKQSEPAIARSIDVARTDISARLRWIKEDAEAVHNRLEEILHI